MKRKFFTTLLLTAAMTLSTISPIYAEEINASVEAEAEVVEEIDLPEDASEAVEPIEEDAVEKDAAEEPEEADAEETVVGEEEKIPFVINDTVYVDYEPYMYYTGEAICPPVTIYVSTDFTKLIEGVDYTLEYSDNIEPGIATITFTGIGRYEGTDYLHFKIYGPKNPIINDDNYYISMLLSGNEDGTFNFENKPITPWVDVYSKEDGRLLEREHFNVIYENNVEVGTATIIVEGVGDFSGTITSTFEIIEVKSKNINGTTTKVETASPSYEYTGMVRKPNPIVTYNDGTESKKLVKDVDYTVSYKNNKEVGNALVIVSGIGEYSGASTGIFTITPVDLKAKGATAKTKSASYPCTGKERKPIPVVKCTVGNKTVTLENGKDFTLSYKNNKNAGTATVTVTGKGNFKGTITTTFKLYNVYELNSTNTTVKTKSASYEYTGYARKPAPVVTYKDGKTTKRLVKDTDYTVAYKNNKNAGTATVTVTGIGNYKGTVSSTFKLTPVKLTTANATAKTCHATYTYTGKERKPVPVVKCKVGSKTYTLEKDKDFTVTYANNKAVGTGTVTVKGIGNYTGTIKATFKIVK